jgi:hypothetical protein
MIQQTEPRPAGGIRGLGAVLSSSYGSTTVYFADRGSQAWVPTEHFRGRGANFARGSQKICFLNVFLLMALQYSW